MNASVAADAHLRAPVPDGWQPLFGEPPPFRAILNDRGQALGVYERDERVAVLQVIDPESPGALLNEVVVVAAEGQQSGSLVASLLARCLRANYRVRARMVAPAQAVRALYAQWDGMRAAVPARVTGSGVSAHDAPEMMRMFDEIAYAAFRRGASDIHMSRMGEDGTIHYRIHGELELQRRLKGEEIESLCSAIYNTMTEAGSTKENFNPAKPQDGAVERVYAEGLVRFRVSVLPIVPRGFDMTLRIIPIGVTARLRTLPELGYAPDQCAMLERIFARKSGLILFAGTTGSGKSTTLATQMSRLAQDNPGRKLRSLEEPVEYRMPGVAQTPVVRLKGDASDFLVMLRQMMRADPDVLMVGEIRDGDTAILAIQATRSGHLCVSTLHADSAVGCYDRLAGMGVPWQELSGAGLIAGLVYQVLVPSLCPHCRVPMAASGDAEIVARLARAGIALDGLYERSPNGCPACEGRGIAGRTVCAEILRPTQAMMADVARGDTVAVYRHWRQTRGGREDCTAGKTAFEHALLKMRAGVLAPRDVERAFHYIDEDALL